MIPTMTGGHDPADTRTHIERLNDLEPAPKEPPPPAHPVAPEPAPMAKEEASAEKPQPRRKNKR